MPTNIPPLDAGAARTWAETITLCPFAGRVFGPDECAPCEKCGELASSGTMCSRGFPGCTWLADLGRGSRHVLAALDEIAHLRAELDAARAVMERVAEHGCAELSETNEQTCLERLCRDSTSLWCVPCAATNWLASHALDAGAGE